MLLLSQLTFGGKIKDPESGIFGGTSVGGKLEIGNAIYLEKGTSDTYISEILDAGEFAHWKDIKLNFFGGESNASSYVIVVESKVNISNYTLKARIENASLSGKLRITDGENTLPYWIDEGSADTIYIRLNLTNGEKKPIYIYYGDDSIGYEPSCEDVFILCDNEFHIKEAKKSLTLMKEYKNLNVWETIEDPDAGMTITNKRYVNIYYKYTMDIKKACGRKEYVNCEENTIIMTFANSPDGYSLIDEFFFNDTNLYPYNKLEGEYWSNKSLYSTRKIKTNELNDTLDIKFIKFNPNTENFNVIITDVFIGYTGLIEPEYRAGNQEVGIFIQVRSCDDPECKGDEFVNVTNNTFPVLEDSRYFQYKIIFNSNDFLPKIYGVDIYYDKSKMPELAESAINEANAKIIEFKEMGIDVSSAEDILKEATYKSSKELYKDAIELANKAKEDAERLYDIYQEELRIQQEKEKKMSEYEKEENKIRAKELLNLAEIAVGAADLTDPNTQKATIMLTQARLAYNAGNYELSIERANDVLEILSPKKRQKYPNVATMLVIIVGMIFVGAVIYSFIKAKLEE